MSSSTSLYPTTNAFLNGLDSLILSGGSANVNTTVTDAASLGDAVASQVLGLESPVSGTAATNDGLSPLLSDVANSFTLKEAITNSLLGGDSSEQDVQNLAALGATLNDMAKTAQQALASSSSTARGQALSSFQSLYDSLDQSSASIDGSAGNAASLGLSPPGDWTDAATGSAAIIQDMTAVVKAHTVVQETIQSVGATLVQSYLLG